MPTECKHTEARGTGSCEGRERLVPYKKAHTGRNDKLDQEKDCFG